MDGQDYGGDQMQEYAGEAVMGMMPDGGVGDTEKAVEYDHQGGVTTMDQNGEEVLGPNNEEERLWAIVNANPADFNSWTQLIQETEKTDDILKFRQCYDTFLAEFPLCYGYWKKYADHEHRLATPEKTIEVYERAVKAVTYSVDIWVHYCSYVALTKPEDPEGLRRLFERGLSYVGTDYLSHQLWDKYIDFEYSHQNWIGITQLYSRILQIPLSALDRYFTHFKELASNRPLQELRGPDENTEAATKDIDAPADLKERTDAPAGEETEESTVSKDPEVQKFIRVREDLYKATKEWDAKIREYESAIRRPYFHVKPLDDIQLLNWHRYLDFLEKEADFDKLMKTYERCLIACANYPEYWIRYIHSMEAKSRFEISDDALERATHIFVKRRPEIHMYAARFKEHRGDTAGARKEYNVLSSEIVPGYLEVIARHANFEKRQGNIEGACAVYESALEVEKAKEDSRTLPFLYVQYIRFLNQAGLIEKSRQTQAVALEKLPFSKVILEAAIHFETLYSGEKEIQKLDNAIERLTGPDVGLATSDREEISSLFLEFLDMYGTPEDIRKAETRHRQHFIYPKSSESKKRPSLDGSMSDRSKLLKTGAGAVPAGGYANGQAQWGYQNWQAQGQQWNQGYPAGYNYAAYGQYPQQPQQQSQQQAQSYAAYPQGYTQPDGTWSATTW